MGDFTYLDNAATTFPKPELVYAVQDEVNRTLAVNAGRGSYRASHKASEIISDCRQRMSRLAGCREDHLIFAPSATIALNQIILGLPWNRYKTVYEDDQARQRVMLDVKSKKFNISLPLFLYFVNQSTGAVTPACNPALTHNITRLETMLVDVFRNEDVSDIELLTNTTKGQKYQSLYISEDRIHLG